MRIFIRAYGSHLMGMGHLYRIKKIVNRLKEQKKCNITLFTQKYDEAIVIYEDINIDNLIEVKPNISIEDESLKLYKILKDNFYEVCINDQLNSNFKIAKILKKSCSKTITFDDVGDGNYLFDSIVNVLYPSTNRVENEINNYSYIILDDYSKIKESMKFSKEIKTIFINQGAADTWGAIPDMIDDLNLIEVDFKIKVLLGPSFKHFNKLAVALRKNKKQIEIINYTDSVVELVKGCELAILGAGNTLFEVASLGIPIIASTREDKELITIDRLVKDNIVYAESILYKNGLNHIVQNVIKNSSNREEKFIQNRNLFQYNGLDKIIGLMYGE